MAGKRGVAARIVVDERGAVVIKAVVEFLVDGVEVDEFLVGHAQRELEEEIRVTQDCFVDIERSGNDSSSYDGDGIGRDFRAPELGRDVGAAVTVAADDARGGIFGKGRILVC